MNLKVALARDVHMALLASLLVLQIVSVDCFGRVAIHSFCERKAVSEN